MLPQAMHPMSSSFLPMTHTVGDHLQAGKAALENLTLEPIYYVNVCIKHSILLEKDTKH
jgi:hypothetical protein